tara:strand:- start:1270 stop:1947 length:678 start_codon:yes stop_codon:yes gene_type:complete
MKKYLSEFIGTAFLVGAILGSNSLAMSIMGESSAAHLAHALSIGGTLMVMIMVFGPISGGHFNPAVTISFLAKGDMKFDEAIPYFVSQILGGVAGAVVINLMYETSIFPISEVVRSGYGQYISEFITTFGLVMIIHILLQNKSESVPFAVGTYIFAAITYSSSTAFANPAVAIGRIFSNSDASIDPISAFSFIVIQIAGGLVAFQVCKFFITSDIKSKKVSKRKK